MDFINTLGVQMLSTGTIVVIVIAVVLIAASVVLGIISKKNKK